MEKLGYKIPEAVEVSGLGRTAIYQYIKEGRLKVRKAGKRTIILSSDLKALLESLPEEAA
jgi:predicted DNA-binding transcriptional regulator AlpA